MRSANRQRLAWFWNGLKLGVIVGAVVGLFAAAFMLIGYALHP